MAKARVFLINPRGGKSRRIHRRRRRRAVSLDRRKRKVYRRKRTTLHRSGRLPRRRHHKGVTVARRRRRRHVRANPVRRHHRRRRRHLMANGPVRRRRRSYRVNARRHRRHFRRNPSFGGITNAVIEGLKDGTAVFGGMIAARKIGNGLNAMIPATVAQSSPVLRGILFRGLGAVVTGIAARKVLPRYAKMMTAGAFAELVNYAAQQQPTLNSFLSAYSAAPVVVRGTRGYPLQLNAGVRGYPGNPGYPGLGAMPMIGLPTTVGFS